MQANSKRSAQPSPSFPRLLSAENAPGWQSIHSHSGKDRHVPYPASPGSAHWVQIRDPVLCSRIRPFFQDVVFVREMTA
ncbi:hypothetical protein CFRS1_v015696 [Colletotrichum fructicola]|nr:hypothetical protein CFRS1_v015696 [Colletotrichum fructicola]